MPFPQLLAGDGVVVRSCRDIGRRLVDVPAEPELLDEDADIGVVFQAQFGELLIPSSGR